MSTKKSSTSVRSVLLHFGLAFVGVMASVLVIGQNSTKHVFAEQALFVSSTITGIDEEQILNFDVPLGINNMTINLTGTDNSDYDINYVCDVDTCSTSYNSATVGTSTETISVDNPEPIAHWQISIKLASGGGDFTVLVTYTFADGADLVNTSGSVDYDGSNSESFNFSTTESVKGLYAVVTSHNGSTGKFDIQLDDPDFNPYYAAGSNDSYKIINIPYPKVGNYTLTVQATSGVSDYDVQVFTQDYAEAGNVGSPIISNNFQNFYTSASSAPSFDLDLTSSDNMVVVVMGYTSSNLTNTYVNGITDQSGNYNFIEACRASYGNNIQTVVYYVPWNNAADETVTFVPDYGNAGGITQFYIAAYGISGSGGVSMPLTGSDCEGTSANNAGLEFPNVKSNDLIIGGVYSLVASNITSFTNPLYAPARNGTSIIRVSNFYGQDISYNMHTNNPFTVAGISIRPYGPIHSPYSQSNTDTTSPIINFSETPGTNTGPDVTFAGTVTDDVEVTSLSYDLDSSGANDVTLSGSGTERSFLFNVDGMSLGSHTIVLTATDSSGNTDIQTFEITVSTDTENPVIDVTTSPSGVTGTSVTFEGTITDNESINFAEYYLNGQNPQTITLDGVSATSKTFSFTLNGLSQASNQVIIYAYDSVGNSSSQEFNFSTDIEKPFCDLISQPAVVNSSTVTYTNVHCTDDVGIAGLHLKVTKDNLFTIIYEGDLTASVTQDSHFGETEETVTFTIPISLPDGIIFVKLDPTDTAGNTADLIGSDFFTVEAQDNTSPTLYLERVRPDPTMDDSPKITGSCSDNSLYDTNTTITNLQFRLDSGSWETVTTLDGNLGNVTEQFSFELSALSTGDHTIDIECTDGASHVSTKSDEFTIIEPVTVSPTLITETEDFDDHINHVLSESNLVWGNGKLRLRETIQTTRNSIDTTNYPTKYINTAYNRYLVAADAVDINKIWYSTTGRISSYTISNNQTTVFDPTARGQLSLGTPIRVLETSVYNGKSYLWVADTSRLQIYNLTDNQSLEVAPIGDIINLTPDTQRGHLGAYILIGGTLKYLDLNGTLENNSDDTYVDVTPVPTGSGLSISIDRTQNDVYIPRYAIGLGKLNDNNTPTNFADDTYTEYSNAQFENNGSVFGVLVDPNGYLLVGMAGFNQTGGLYVVLNHNTTPADASDDTVLKLADSTQIKNLNVYGITYMEGRDGVGDQLFLTGELGDAYYLNFNDTYTDLLDDTYIRLKITTDNRGVDNNSSYRGSALFIVKDYNTLYVNGDLDGFQRYDLTRGWENSGQAVVYSTPQDRLVANYFELKDIQNRNDITIASDVQPENNIFNKLRNLLFPKVQAQSSPTVTYSVSVDDGVTWSPITLSEILNMSQNDYRVKFRIEMTQANNTTPVVDSYTLAFGAYQNETQAHVYSLNLNVLPSSVGTLQDFTLSAKIIDELGFTNTSYNGTISLNLIDSATSTDKSNLLNVSTINIVNGEAILNNVKISAAGTYVITGSFESNSYFSNVVTVSTVTVTPVPTMSFIASRYSINPGETTTLTWNTENLTSVSINRGIGILNTLDGSLNVSPTSTTVYTLSGTGPYGDLQAYVTITVNQPSPNIDNGTLDADSDGLTNSEEATLGTNPNNPDSDNDGLLDGEEVKGCLFTPNTTTCSTTTFPKTNPLDPNTDDDSLLDGEEVKGCYFKIGEIVCSTDVFTPTDPTDPNSPAKLPVAEVVINNLTPETPTQSETPVTQQTDILSDFTNSVKTGTVPAALVATTATATALTAVTYPNFISYAFLWFRRKKKKEGWGFVYDVTNNKPIPFVTVRIKNSQGKFIAEEISDINGKYAIVIKPGEYKLEAKVNDYEKYESDLTIQSESINVDIALTPINPEYSKKVVIRNWLKANLPKLNAAVFFIGLIFSIITLAISPTVINLLIVIVFIVQIVIYYWLTKGKTGRVFDSADGTKLKGVIIRVFEKEAGRQLGSVSTNNNGMYNIFLKPGKYLVKVESLQYQISEKVAKFKDAVGVPYLEVDITKEGLLNLEIPMVRKTHIDDSTTGSSKFGYLGN